MKSTSFRGKKCMRVLSVGYERTTCAECKSSFISLKTVMHSASVKGKGRRIGVTAVNIHSRFVLDRINDITWKYTLDK